MSKGSDMIARTREGMNDYSDEQRDALGDIFPEIFISIPPDTRTDEEIAEHIRFLEYKHNVLNPAARVFRYNMGRHD